jgi:hypothetical protein
MMDDQKQLKEHLETIINCIKGTLNSLKEQQVSNPETLLTNSTLNNNANTFSLNPEENELLIILTEKIENILKNFLSSLDDKSRKYVFNMLHEYHYDRNEKKFTSSLTMNNLYAFLNDLESTRSSLDAFIAAWEGKITPVREFIRNYPQFKDKPGIWGTTLLYSAARNNRLQLVDYLVATAHCSINAQNEQHLEKALTTSPVTAPDFVNAPTAGSTALHGACFYEHLDVVKYLIEHGADYFITNHAEETPIKNAEISHRITEYSIETDILPEKAIIEGGQDLTDDCMWEYKPFSDPNWYQFSPAEKAELSQSLKVPSDQQFQQEIHLNVRRGIYSVSTVKFLRSGRDRDPQKNLAWIRCRGSSILNFDCYSIWQLMIIQHPSIESKTLSSLEPFDIPPLNDSKFKLQGNTWYNCPLKINMQLDKAINYRQKILSLKFPFINDQLIFNLQTFSFANNEKTILGFIRWIPKIISIEQNTNKITYLDNFKPMIGVNPVVMTSKHQKQIINKDDKTSTGAGEHELTDDINDDGFYSSDDSQSDNYDENLTSQKKVSEIFPRS